jgi:hypothetical protein
MMNYTQVYPNFSKRKRDEPETLPAPHQPSKSRPPLTIQIPEFVPKVLAKTAGKPAVPPRLVAENLELVPHIKHGELSVATRQRAQAEACAIVCAGDPMLGQVLEVRVITTRQVQGGEETLSNHVNLRVHPAFATMIHHERAGAASDEDIMFCFMASEQLEPLVIVVAVHARLGRLETLSMTQLTLLEAAIKQFKCRFRLDGESYAYTCLKERQGASVHSRHFHLKIRIPTEMYLRVFPAMQVLGGNLACKRHVLNPFKERWEPLSYKFSTQNMFPWDLARLLMLSDIL